MLRSLVNKTMLVWTMMTTYHIGILSNAGVVLKVWRSVAIKDSILCSKDTVSVALSYEWHLSICSTASFMLYCQPDILYDIATSLVAVVICCRPCMLMPVLQYCSQSSCEQDICKHWRDYALKHHLLWGSYWDIPVNEMQHLKLSFLKIS